jgi:hypothetical protein
MPRRQRPLVELILEVAECEPLVLDDRPDAQPPVLRNVKVPGLTTCPAASVPTQSWLRKRVIEGHRRAIGAAAVTVLTPAPMKLPCRTSNGATFT